jgi:hypothetical protein
MTDQLPTIERHMFRPFKDNVECTYVDDEHRRCREVKAHDVHTPTGTTREKWLWTKLKANGWKSREAAQAILRQVEQAGLSPENAAAVIEALHDIIDETSHWRDSWAYVTVEMDHKVREAMARSELCEVHGEEIKELGKQIDHFLNSYRKADAGRVALIGALFRMEQFTDGYDLKVALGQDVPDGPAIVAALRKSLTQAHAAHKRAVEK